MSSQALPNRSRDGFFAILMVLVPGSAKRRVGVILVDAENEIHLKTSDVLFAADSDVLEYWSALNESLSDIGRDLGGKGTLDWLQETASNFLQISEIFPFDLQEQDPQTALAALYGEHILAARNVQTTVDQHIHETRLNRYSLSDIGRARERIPTTCTGALKTLRSIRSADPIADLEQILRDDLVMASHVVRLANMVRFSRGSEVRTLSQALFRIGLDTALGYVAGLSLRPLYSSPLLRNVWNSSLRCRDNAVKLGQLIAYEDNNYLSLVALIANIGKIVLAELRGFDQAFREVREQGYTELASERILCGIAHDCVGADLLFDWGFESGMVEAVRFHHSPSRTCLPEASLVFLADCLVTQDHGAEVQEEKERALNRLNISAKNFDKQMISGSAHSTSGLEL